MDKEETLKTTKLSKKTLLRLLRYAVPYWPWFILAVLIIFAIVYLELMQPVLLGRATNIIADGVVGTVADQAAGAKEAAVQEILNISLTFAAFVLLTLLLSYIQSLILGYVGQKIVFRIREDVFGHLQKLSVRFFNDNPIGRLVTRATNDIDALNEMYTSVIVNILKSICMLAGIIITMVSFNLRLSLYTFSIIPIIIISTAIYTIASRRTFRTIRAKVAALNAFVSEHVSGMKIIQIFGVEKKMKQQFEEKSEELRKTHIRQIAIHALYGPMSNFLNIMALLVLLWFGGRMYLEGVIQIGVIVTFQRYIGKFFEPIQEFAEQLATIQSASASAERIFGLLDEKIDITDSEDAIELENPKGKIEFRNVWFAYKDEDWILKDVSFCVEPGQKAAFVGATGAGKTTIQNLIGRYYDIQRGEILIDGVDIKKLKVDSIRKNIGQMLQDVFLFTGDIKRNIRLRNENITDEEVIAASKYVNAHPFISKLGKGYEDEVIERGASFSAGQRQLISFARTLAFQPKILILDEATANIDTETESLIQDALAKIMEGRTTLVVAHRLSTIQNADKIIVMHKGRIVEQGSHQELLSGHGMYYKLYKLQYEHI